MKRLIHRKSQPVMRINIPTNKVGKEVRTTQEWHLNFNKKKRKNENKIKKG